jgi:hypothetical protein
MPDATPPWNNQKRHEEKKKKKKKKTLNFLFQKERKRKKEINSCMLSIMLHNLTYCDNDIFHWLA